MKLNKFIDKECVALIVILIVFVFDRVTKYIAQKFLSSGKVIDLWLFDFRYSENTGAAFSILKGHNVFLAVFGVILLIVLLYLLSDLPKRFMFAKGLMVGGAIGNLFDRMVFHRVIDFIDFRFWPVFNIADIGLIVGVILIVVLMIRRKI